MTQRFSGKTVVITGASAGIGAECARLFAREGARLVLAARSPKPLEDMAAEIKAMGQAIAVPMDVSDSQAASDLLARAEREFGAIHVLVNNAGMNRRSPVEDAPPADLARIVDVNLRAPVVLSRLALPYLRKSGGGAIVNVASLAGHFPVAGEAVYSASKFGLRAFTFAMAQELEGTNIRVCAVSPGPVETEFLLGHLDEVPDLVFSQPMSSARQIAELVVACAADGKRERVAPRVSGYLAAVANLFPGIGRALMPVMKQRGRKVKEQYRRARSHDT